MSSHRQLVLRDYLGILRRRAAVLITPALVLAVGAYSASLILKNQYTATTTVLVEQQRVPDDFVRPVVTEDLAERLATMQEQILSRTRLEPMIQRFGLYKESRHLPMEDLLERMRKSINVTSIRGDARGRNSVTGFAISFTSEDPRLAQRVCTEIASMFMEENLRVREQRAQNTTDFLSKQLHDAKTALDEQDRRLAEFKTRYMGQLPEQQQQNLALLSGYVTQLEATTQALNRAQQDKSYTEAMLAQQTAAWNARQSQDANPQAVEQQLATAQAQVIALQARYTDDHPDVIKAKSNVAQMRKKLEASKTPVVQPPPADSPAGAAPADVLQLRNQVHSLEAVVKQRQADQKRLQDQVHTMQARLNLTPVVEEQYKNLTRDYQTALTFYNELLAKKAQSEMATDLERQQQGERFKIVDPANLPEKPVSPNRPLIAFGGFALGGAVGLGVTMFLEIRRRPLRTVEDVEFYLELPVLAGLSDKRGFWKQRLVRLHKRGRVRAARAGN